MKCPRCDSDTLVLFANGACAKCQSAPPPAVKKAEPKPEPVKPVAKSPPPKKEEPVNHQRVAREYIAKRHVKRRRLGRLEVLLMIEKKIEIKRSQTDDESERRAYTESIKIVQDHEVIFNDPT